MCSAKIGMESGAATYGCRATFFALMGLLE